MKELNVNNDVAYNHASEGYWLTHLAGELPVLNFPKFNTRQFNKTYKNDTVSYVFPKELMEKARSFSVEHNITLFTLLMAGVNILLYKYTHQTDILIATNSNALTQEDDAFANTLLIRTAFNKQHSVKELLANQQTVLHEAFEHRDYPFDKLKEQLRNMPESGFQGLPEVFVALNTAAHRHGIGFLFTADDELQLSIDYNAAVYNSKMMQKLPAHFEQVLNNMMADEAACVKDVEYLSADEIKELMMLHNVRIDYPAHKTIIDLFEEQVRLHPQKAAVVSEENSISYKELDELSDRLANHLLCNGVKPGSYILFCFNHRMELSLVGMLGIMKAGCAYVPLDSDLPKERIAFLVRDTASPYVVTNSTDAAVFTDEKLQVINLDEAGNWLASAAHKERATVLPQQLAYVIYTSGTTGDPKGVMITHNSLVDYYFGIDDKIGIAQQATHALMSTLATDLGNTLLFAALIYGNTLHLFSKDALRNIEYLHNYFNNNKIDCIKVVPTYWNALEYHNTYLLPRKMVIFGGEQLSASTVARVRNARPDVTIVNHYGPTEVTIGKLLHQVKHQEDENVIPIGRPFSNATAYVVDEDLALCTQGVWGELLIGGTGVFNGYLNNAALTAAKCIENNRRFPGERLYRTGDLVRINENGDIEFGSRVDDQVKIQGYRIELGGIEAFIRQYPHVKHCFVNVVENGDTGKMLVAYLEVNTGYAEDHFKEFLKMNLPVYMIPSVLVKVPELPMKSNGKVDKKKLFIADLFKTSPGYEAPQNEVQQVVVGILEEMFNRKQISIHDNFYELGGDSIKSIQMASRLRQRGYKLQLKDIIKNPVIKDLAAQVKINAPVKLKEDMFSGAIPFSPIQELFFSSKKGNYNHYNQSVILHADELHEEYVQKAFDELVKFHDTLRIKFRMEGFGEWKQFYDVQAHYSFETVVYESEQRFQQKMAEMGSSLDIQQGPLIRLCLFKGDAQDILYIVIHHLLIDGVSFRILIEDLANLYRRFQSGSAFELRHKSSSLKEWHTKLIEYSGKEALIAETDYWQGVDKAEFDRLKHADAVKNTIADREKFVLTLDDLTTADLLTKCYRRHNTEIIEILLTTLYMALRDTFNIQKLTMNLEGHGREHIGYDLDVSRTLGWFTTIYPVHIDMNDQKGYVNRLLQVKECLNNIPVKGIGYGVLKYLRTQDLDVEPEVRFNYLGDFSLGLNGKDANVFKSVKFNYQDASELTTCSDILDVTGILENNKLSVYFNYNKLLFADEEIRSLGKSFEIHLLNIIDQIALS
jgi:amino acid adenylation domain-containing protein/non-ribosomal peptide synthase protein (TIGR01720 family)